MKPDSGEIEAHAPRGRWCDDCGHRLDPDEVATVTPTRFGDFTSCGPCESWREPLSSHPLDIMSVHQDRQTERREV